MYKIYKSEKKSKYISQKKREGDKKKSRNKHICLQIKRDTKKKSKNSKNKNEA